MEGHASQKIREVGLHIFKNNIPNEIIESVIKVNDLQKDYFINKIFKRFSKKISLINQY